MISYVKYMGEKVLEIVNLTIESLKNYNLQLAEGISSKEKEIDRMYFDFLDKLRRRLDH